MSDGTLRLHRDTLIFTPNVYPSNQVKQFGFTWKKAPENCWTAPISIDKINGACSLFTDIDIDWSVRQWKQENARLVECPPQEDLFIFQNDAVKFLMTHPKVLLALAPGLGKTAVAARSAELKKCKRILTIVPLSLMRNWSNELKKWYKTRPFSIERCHQKVPSGKATWTIANYDTILRYPAEFLKIPFDAVIIDESLMVKNRKAKRTRSLSNFVQGKYDKSLIPGRRGTGISVIRSMFPTVWLLSGAPVTKFYDDMWAQLNILDPKRFSSYWRFANTYCLSETDQWGTQIVANQPKAAERLKEDLSDAYFFMTQKEALPNIPDWLFENGNGNIEIEMSSEQCRIYDEMETMFRAQLSEEPGDVIVAMNTLSRLVRLIQIASNPLLVGGPDDGAKWRAIMELSETIRTPAIIWTNFITTAEYLTKTLKGSQSLTGRTKEQDRQRIVNEFQAGEIPFLIAHPEVGKYGFTLTAGKSAVYLELGYNADHYYQSLYRLKRIGTIEAPVINHLIAARPNGGGRTVDHVIRAIMKYRFDMIKDLTSLHGMEYKPITYGELQDEWKKPTN